MEPLGTGAIRTLTVLICNCKKDPTWHGVLFCLGLFTTSTIAVILDHHGLQRLVVSAIQMRYLSFTNTVIVMDVLADTQSLFCCRNASVSAIYRKSLRLSSKARQRFTTGEITNFMSGGFLRSFHYSCSSNLDSSRCPETC